MEFDFSGGITVGRSSDLYESQRGAPNDGVAFRSSGIPRGLALRSLVVSNAWDSLWNLLGLKQRIYFLSIAFDLSGQDPLVLPPKEVPADAVFPVHHGEKISFALGEGAPLFLPRIILGGLVVYIMICSADKGVRHIGEVMAKVHDDLSNKGSIVDVIKGLATNPGKAVADSILGVATAALQPIATILKNSEDDYHALFTGVFSAKGPWRDRLTASQSGATIELAELSG
jgi:hypothetical protein